MISHLLNSLKIEKQNAKIKTLKVFLHSMVMSGILFGSFSMFELHKLKVLSRAFIMNVLVLLVVSLQRPVHEGVN